MARTVLEGAALLGSPFKMKKCVSPLLRRGIQFLYQTAPICVAPSCSGIHLIHLCAAVCHAVHQYTVADPVDGTGTANVPNHSTSTGDDGHEKQVLQK